MTKNPYLVYHKDKPVLKINAELLKLRGCEENLEAIKAKHQERLEIAESMEREDDASSLRWLDAAYTRVEFELQDLWKFKRDVNYHRFWYRPKCRCPKLDNEDAYPTGIYVTSSECKIHWKF